MQRKSVGGALQSGYNLDNLDSSAVIQEMADDAFGVPAIVELQVHGSKVAADR